MCVAASRGGDTQTSEKETLPMADCSLVGVI